MQPVSRERLLRTALDAALEIEAALTHRRADRDKIQEFIGAIDSYRASDATSDPLRLVSDPALFPAVTRAATATGGHLTTVQQIQEWLRELVSSSRVAANNTADATEALRRLQAFCLQLRSEIMTDVSSERAMRVKRPAANVYQVDPAFL